MSPPPVVQGASEGAAQPGTWGASVNGAWRQARRIVILVIGSSVVLLGLALVVLPGPAFIVIPAGLAILATEFVWARRLLRKARDGGAELGSWLFGKKSASMSAKGSPSKSAEASKK